MCTRTYMCAHDSWESFIEYQVAGMLGEGNIFLPLGSISPSSATSTSCPAEEWGPEDGPLPSGLAIPQHLFSFYLPQQPEVAAAGTSYLRSTCSCCSMEGRPMALVWDQQQGEPGLL